MQINAQEWMRRRDAGEYVRVLLDGVDVTLTGVFCADDEAGTVHRFLKNAEGNHYQLDGEIAKETLHGQVQFIVEPIAVEATKH